ncbi:unnamed protein product [Oikopleura dioica]|uniref:Uncharacterized protein n=1 Tax=Oikopleura dioica TaxID=34765 RepID=E4X083_OIKDI|nr:unnamed protein product [Oikopleura dioica]
MRLLTLCFVVEAVRASGFTRMLAQGENKLQRFNQNRLRRLIARQGDVLSRNKRYNPEQMKSLNWIYEDMRKKLLEEASLESTVYFQQLNKKLQRQEKQIRRISRDRKRGRQYIRESSRRTRRDAAFSTPSSDALMAVVRHQSEQIRELQNRNEVMQQRMAVFEEDLENSRADFGALKTDTRDMLLEKTEGSGSSFADYETVTFLDQSESSEQIVGNSTMEELIQELVFRIDSMEYRMNQTSEFDSQTESRNSTGQDTEVKIVELINRLEGIEEKVQEKTNRLTALEVNLADNDSLGKNIYDSINSTSSILTHLEEFQIDMRQKLSENEDNMLRLNSTVTDTVNSLVDFGGMVIGLQDALHSFRTHYSQYKDESELQFVNTSAHLKSVDETQALSIELFDRMDAVNEEFRERVLWLQELLVLSRNETEEYDASKLFDDSSDYNPTFV